MDRRTLLWSLTPVAWLATGTSHAQHALADWPAGLALPAIEALDLQGRPWRLAELRGRPVLLNFWASWCEPCRAEMPSLELLAAQHERNGLTILAVNYKEPLPTIKRFLDALPFSLPILLDRDGDATGEWTPRIFPTTVLIDRSGVPRQSVLGELEWNGPVARGLIEPLLVRPKSA